MKALSEERVDEIVDLFAESKSINGVAKATGLSYASVEKYLVSRNVGLPTKRGGGKPKGSNTVLTDNTQNVLDLYKSGLRVYEIAQKLAIADSSVSKILANNNVKVFLGNSRLSSELRSVVAHKASQGHRKRLGLPELDLSRAFEILHDKVLLEELVRDPDIDTVYDIAEYLQVSYTTVIPALHRAGLWSLVNHYTRSSQGEKEVQELIESWGVKIAKDQSVIYPMEIDLYSDDLKIGVEFNGDYWHSEVHKGNRYHQKKSFAAEAKGVFIYHVFEYEWNDPEKRVKITSQMANLFGVNSKRVFARKCTVRLVDIKQAREFLNANHIQGADRSSIKLGLFLGEELVSLMTFCRPRFSKKYEWELSRFCSLSGTNVIGGAGKLFSHFIREQNPSTVISYADVARTKGKVYPTLGFVQTHIADPNYIWTDFRGNVLTRYQTQMRGEIATMQSKGMKRIFDSGCRVFVWTSPTNL